MAKASELRELTDEVLEQRLVETKDELFRISTLLREREIATAEEQMQES